MAKLKFLQVQITETTENLILQKEFKRTIEVYMREKQPEHRSAQMG